jgi:hypothetical protein
MFIIRALSQEAWKEIHDEIESGIGPTGNMQT